MKYVLSFTLLIFGLFANPIFAQIEGDNIFANDQIITIELTFHQENFWDSLTTNYETETYMKADLVLTDETGTASFEDVGVRLKGNSSYGHPGNKKSFKIDFNKYVSGQNYDGLKKLNFSNAFKDPAIMREKIFFDICRDAEVPAPRANFANVYFNGTLWGFYSVIEQIDDQFLDWKILDDDGNLFKAGANFGGGPGGGGDAADLVYYGDEQTAYEDKYELKSNEDENDWSDLISLIDFINNSSDEDFEANIEEHLALDEYLRSAALDNLFSNLDSYTNSARNYYIYHNLTTEQWQWIKWDANESFGTYRGGPGAGDMTSLALDYHSNDRPLLERIFDNENLYLRYQSHMCDLVDNFFNEAYMFPHIDNMKALIETSVYNDDNKMYTDANFDTNVESNINGGGGPGGGTTYGLKSFVTAKENFVSSQLDCSFVSTDDTSTSNQISIYPNPTNGQITVSWDHENVETVTIYNSLGQEIFSLPTNGATALNTDLTNLANGIYFVALQTNTKKYNKQQLSSFVKH